MTEKKWEEDMFNCNYTQIPLKALNMSSRLLLSSSLNPEQLITADNGLARDYRGLAELLGFSYFELRNFQRSTDPTKALLETVESTPRRLKTEENLDDEPREISFKDLNYMLEQIERFDVMDDLKAFLTNDAKQFIENQQKKQQLIKCQKTDWIQSLALSQDSPHHITVDDALNPSVLIQYDAYICYADEDYAFVQSLVGYLESPQIGLKLFVRDRDSLLGTMQYDVFIRLIEERCNRMVIILSPDFLKCAECEYQTRFAATLGIERRCRMLIPIIYKPCDLPQIIRMVTKIDLVKANGIQEWIWRKIVASIRGPANTSFIVHRPSYAQCSEIEPPKSIASNTTSMAEKLFIFPDPSAPPPTSESIFKEVTDSNRPTLALPDLQSPSSSSRESEKVSIPTKSEKKTWYKSIKQRITGSSGVSSETYNGYQSLNKQY